MLHLEDFKFLTNTSTFGGTFCSHTTKPRLLFTIAVTTDQTPLKEAIWKQSYLLNKGLGNQNCRRVDWKGKIWACLNYLITTPISIWNLGGGGLVLYPIISTLLPHLSVCMTQSFCTQTPPAFLLPFCCDILQFHLPVVSVSCWSLSRQWRDSQPVVSGPLYVCCFSSSALSVYLPLQLLSLLTHAQYSMRPLWLIYVLPTLLHLPKCSSAFQTQYLTSTVSPSLVLSNQKHDWQQRTFLATS